MGVDLPLGIYRIKNKVYSNVSNLNYQCYNGNESYYPGEILIGVGLLPEVKDRRISLVGQK